MNYWKFTSANNWFTAKFPENWSEYEDDDGTYAFFNSATPSGNFRITPFRWQSGNNRAHSYIQDELNDNLNAVSIKVGNWDGAFYSKKADEDNLIYFWITGFENTVFLCSFTVEQEAVGTKRHDSELNTVDEIINSLTLV
jgi:hypothetical protein